MGTLRQTQEHILHLVEAGWRVEVVGKILRNGSLADRGGAFAGKLADFLDLWLGVELNEVLNWVLLGLRVQECLLADCAN